MRWEDERYVRIYTRNTPDWAALPWESRATFYELCRHVDRSGYIALGKSGIRGLAAILLMPLPVVEAGIAGLLDDGCIKRVDGGLLVDHFLEAQETPQSDKLRKRIQRERDRDNKRATADDASSPPPESRDGGEHGQGVTFSDPPSRFATATDETSRDVTPRPSAPESVTLYCAVPSLAVPISHTLPPAPARDVDLGLGNLATPEVLLAIVGDYPRLSLLHGNREWSQNAGTITAEKLVRSEDARAAIQAFLIKKSTQTWACVDDLSGALGGFLANAKKHGDDARRAAARAAEQPARPTRVRFSGPGAPNPTQTAFVPLAADERPWSPEEP